MSNRDRRWPQDTPSTVPITRQARIRDVLSLTLYSLDGGDVLAETPLGTVPYLTGDSVTIMRSPAAHLWQIIQGPIRAASAGVWDYSGREAWQDHLHDYMNHPPSGVAGMSLRAGGSASPTPRAWRTTGGYFFHNITIPQGETIVSASLHLLGLGPGSPALLTLNANVGLEDVDDAEKFTAIPFNAGTYEGVGPHDRVMTTATTDVDEVDGSGSGFIDIDLTSAVQEVIDRAGWLSGNNMMVLIEGKDIGAIPTSWFEGNRLALTDHTTLSIATGSGEIERAPDTP